MSKPIGLTVISNEDFHLELADGLRENLATFGYDLIIHIVDKDKANDWQALQNWYQIKDETLIEFASQEKRRIWLLDSEVRIVRDLPTRCIDSNESVIFYTDPNDKIYPPINTGQCIVSRDMIPFYAQSIQMAKAAKEANIMEYNVEYFLPDLDLPPHVKELISFDRRIADSNSICSRGLFVNDNTCITHPYLHNVSLYMDEPEDIPLLTPRTFLNHFSPFDYNLALKVLDLMVHNIDDIASWRSLPLQRFGSKKQFVSYFYQICPKNITSDYLKTREYLCFCVGDWYFCPRLRMAGPKKYWLEYAYQLTDH